jgi:hypothetical protein
MVEPGTHRLSCGVVPGTRRIKGKASRLIALSRADDSVGQAHLASKCTCMCSLLRSTNFTAAHNYKLL